MIEFVSPKTNKKLVVKDNTLISSDNESFIIKNGIPRFVPEDNYASAFGLQWKNFALTQLDSSNKTSITKERVERCLGFPISNLRNKDILEVGCGAGRFTELLVQGNGHVHAIDLSVAVEVNKENVGSYSNYSIAQASVYEIPFPDDSFDIVFCLGVIQHTPDPEKTIECLYKKLKPGGLLVIDHYIWRIGYYTTLTPIFRAWLKELPPNKSKIKVDKIVDFFFPLHWKFKNSFALNWLLHRVSPLIEYINAFPDKDYNFHYELSKLDTNDQLTDYYKHLRSPEQIQKTLEKLGGKNIWINVGGNGVEARCVK
jgi:SAM-dependent methyltransferase